MKSTVKLMYSISIQPYEDDEEDFTFSLYPQRLSSETVKFTIAYPRCQDTEKYLGLLDDNVFFIDSNTQRGLLINTPLNTEETTDDLIDLDIYDEDECMVLAKSIEVITQDFLGFRPQDFDLPF